MHHRLDLSRRHRSISAILSVLVTGLIALTAPPVEGQTQGKPVRLSLVAIDLEGAGAVPLRLAIDRWTSDTEYDRLLSILMDKGQEAFGSALRDARSTGYVRTLDSLGWDLRLARETRGKDGGRQISLITDRPIGFAESWYASRSIDYPFTVIELSMNGDDEGSGSMSVATKLIPDKANKILIIENFDNQRIRLTQVKRD